MRTRIFTIIVITTIGLSGLPAAAQKKADRKTLKQLQADITYLASDELEGRRTGTEGEHKAADYIEKRYKDIEIGPYHTSYRYPFQFAYGKDIGVTTQIYLNNNEISLKDAFPLPFSASKHVNTDILPDVIEQGNVWLAPLYSSKDQASDPHFESEKYMFEQARELQKKGASGVIFYDNYDGNWKPVFNHHSEYDPLEIPVVFVNNAIYQKYIANATGAINVDMTVSVSKTERTGTNLAAYIDNHAPYTVLIGAHYDHLGYGEDGNSLLANAVKEHQVHHGADDNASGTAALMEVAARIKKDQDLNHYNYLFVHFSGEELGLYGSKAFVKEPGIDSAHIAYMINMDMVGRLNDSTHALTLGGVGTSPAWSEAVELAGNNFKLNIDSSGVGPSDHTSFYYAGIPVLFFFTGTHHDYHKPSDTAGAINYKGELQVIKYVQDVVAHMDEEPTRPAFTATKQKAAGKSTFKVTLGIMPDYTFDNGGVRVDGVSDNRPAIKAGIKAGDIITRLGDHKINGMQSYMEALGKFMPGDKTMVTITRNGKEMVLPIELNK